jgi:hypothetical protein
VKSIWSVIKYFECEYEVDELKCSELVEKLQSVVAIEKYLTSLKVKLNSAMNSDAMLNEKHEELVEEAWSVAIPIAYRFAIDDTARNFRIGSELKELTMRLVFPNEINAFEKELNNICSAALGISYQSLEREHAKLKLGLENFASKLPEKWRVYGRIKNPSSILNKFYKYKIGQKKTKPHDKSEAENIDLLIERLEENIKLSLEPEKTEPDQNKSNPYNFETLKWLLPDLLAFTIQMEEEEDSKKNLGANKSKYRKVYRLLEKENICHIYYGPDYSTKWHMNRMVCYLEVDLDLLTRIPCELFIRTDVDYFIGFGLYWIYKDTGPFMEYKHTSKKFQEWFISESKKCKNFDEVKQILLNDVLENPKQCSLNV